MKKYLILFLFLPTLLFAQEKHYYYYKGEKQYLTLNKNKVNFTAINSFNSESLKEFGLNRISFNRHNFEKEEVVFRIKN